MLRTIGFIAIFSLLSNLAYGAPITCGMDPTDIVLNNEKLSYEVAGSGRLYLLSGPDHKCLNKNLFVVPGDALVAYQEYGEDGEWSYVAYTTKSGKNVEGWVQTKRLRFTGASGGNMSPETSKFFQDAAEAAKNGKLGRPG